MTNIIIAMHEDNASILYTFFKDFQTILAFIFALCAALIAFYSAQRVARIQSATTRELADKQAAQAKTRDDETMARQRVAFLVRTIELITSLAEAAEGISTFISEIETASHQLSQEIKISWDGILNNKPLKEEFQISGSNLEEISCLNRSDQVLIHKLTLEINDASDTLDHLKQIGLEDDPMLPRVKREMIELASLSRSSSALLEKSIATDTP